MSALRFALTIVSYRDNGHQRNRSEVPRDPIRTDQVRLHPPQVPASKREGEGEGGGGGGEGERERERGGGSEME